MPGLVLLRIQCGLCLRTYTKVDQRNYLRPSSLRARPPLKISVSVPWGEPPELPSALLAAFPPGTRIRESLPGQGGRLTFTCHPTKCRREHSEMVTTTPITFSRWTRAVEEALNAGRRELLIGGPGGL